MAEGGREGNMQVGDGGISNTVEVRGFSMRMSQELMEMYFENSRRSGGGDVEEVKIRDEVAYITFKEAEVAQKVASRSNHQVDGQTLTVTLFHPLPPKPCYQNRVLIQGLNNALAEELLRNFLETKIKAQVTEFLYGEEDGNVVVTFSDNIDIVQLGKIFQESSIEGVFLKVARVAISNCILVQNLHPSTSHDVILYYFENKRRSGGGDVERVEMKTEESYCLIYFEDPSVIDRVLGQSHNVDGVDFEIHLHHECLGRRSSRKRSDLYLRMSSPRNKDIATLEDENADNQANDKTSSSVSSNPEKESDFVEVQEWQENDGNNCTLPLWIKYKRAPDKKIIRCMKNIPCSWNFHLYWNFYTKTEPGNQMLLEILNKYNCSVTAFTEDEDLYIFEISEKIFEQESDVVQLIYVVLDSVHKCAQQFLYLDNLLVDQRIQGDVLQVVRQRKELNIARFELMGQQDFDALCVICTEKDQTLVLDVVTEIIHIVKECFENHEETIHVDHKWQKVMKTFGYLQKLCEKYPNVTISDKTEAAIMLKGPKDQSKPAADHFLELLGTASSEVQEEIFSPGCQFEIFTYPEMCGYIDTIAIEHSIVWIPNHQTKKIHLFSKKSEKKKGVDKFIRGCVQERLYPLAKDQTVFSTKIIRSLEELKKMHTGKMVFSSSHKGLLLTATDDIFESIDDAVQEIICKETELQISRVHEEAEADRTKTTIAERGQFPKQSNENEDQADTTKPREAGKEQRGNKAMSTEELWQKIPAWNKEDVMICYGKTTCVLFPSNDVDLDESFFFQSLFLDHSWSKCFLEYLQKKQFSIKKENVRIPGKFVQHIIISGKIEHTNVDKYQMLYQLVQECGIRATLLKKNSLECEHILQESSALVAEHPMSIYRNIQGDKLVLIGHEQNLKEIMKVYGLESIESKGYLFGESVEVSSHDAFLFTELNLGKFLQFDKCNVKCHVTKGIQNPTLIFVGMSLKQIREASESTTRFLEKVPCDKLVLPNVKFNLCKQIEAKHYVEERLKQKGINCVIFVDDEAVQLFSVTENLIKLAKSEIECCINTHMLPTNIYKTLLEQNLNGGKLNIISDKENICFVVCTFDISEQILEIMRSSTTRFVCSSVSKIEWDFICKHYAETLKRIEGNYGVKITTMNNGLQVLGGSGFNKEELEKEIRQLLPKRKENIPVDPSLEGFVLSEEGRGCLKQLAVDNKTMCDIHVGDDGAKDACDNLLCSWYFENVSQQILLVQWRAADLHVDCLVIPVNEGMVPLTCVEHGIQESFDEEMRKEVTDNSAKLGQLIECSVWIEGEHKGKLKCNKLPVYLTVRNRNRLITNQELHDKLKEIFRKAESLKLESVGLPVEGVSESKFTLMLRAAVEAASVFFKHGNGQNLKKVYLCTMKKDDADLKINEVEKTLEETKTSTSTFRIRKGIKSLLRFPNDEIKTKVMFGSLHETKADVLVNTVTKHLDLGKGAVSKQILKLAGKGIQDELKRKYPNGIKSLEIALTEPHELVGFKKVFHVAVDELEPNIIEKIKILKALTCKCLEFADGLKMSSIAFPALGTGGLDYPFRDVAWAMFEAVSDFQHMGQKHLKKVKFVLFKTDDKTILAFSNEDNRRKEKRDSSRTRKEVGKVPELLIGRINNQKRPEFKIMIESEYPVPSFAVEVFIKVQKGHRGVIVDIAK